MPEGPDIASVFGAGSPLYDRVFSGLLDLFQRRTGHPRVALRYREWCCHRSIAGPTLAVDDETFVRHTYISILSRLIARSLLGVAYQISQPQQLGETLTGGFFREQGIDNFAEDDFFTWPTTRDGDDEALKVIAPLVEEVRRRPVIQDGYAPLARLYDEQEEVPVLAETTGDSALALQQAPATCRSLPKSVYHTGCGGGEALYQTVSGMATTLLEQGMDEFDTLLVVLDRVAATDTDPLAVVLGRANYLFALGSMVTGPHPPVFLPVYLSGHTPGSSSERAGTENANVISVGESQTAYRLPVRVADDLQLLEWLAGRLPNYLDGAALRSISQSRDAATEEVMIAFHNYLLAPKPRTPVPEPLILAEAEVMEETAAALVRLYLEERDLFRLFQLKNAAASAHLARQQFDRVIVG